MVDIYKYCTECPNCQERCITTTDRRVKAEYIKVNCPSCGFNALKILYVISTKTYNVDCVQCGCYAGQFTAAANRTYDIGDILDLPGECTQCGFGLFIVTAET